MGSNSRPYTTNIPSKQQTKSYGNKHVNAELEALKQRGLAKLLNKHFTETALQLEQEKAAADAALKDLELRKAQTSEFKPANYNGVSPLDEMAIQANKWRAECRRKERETMLLYQRYVHRFGDAIPSILPNATPDSPLTSAPPPRKAPEVFSPGGTQVPNMAAQIEATLEEYMKQGAVSLPSMQILGKDETYQMAHQKEEEQFRNFYRRQLEGKGIDVPYQGFSITGRPDFPGFPIHTIDENENDDDSVVSGLTTLQSVILQDCERSVVTYLQEEHEQIQKLVQNNNYDENDAETAISQAESMVQQMEEILAEYQSTRAIPSAHHKPREYATDNPNEHWMVYYDEFYQQEYYHEKHTNRTQWEPPSRTAMDGTSCSSDALTVSEVMPDMRVYRQRRTAKRRSRNRAVMLIMMSVLVIAYIIFYRDETSWMRQYIPQELLQYLPQSQERGIVSVEENVAVSDPKVTTIVPEPPQDHELTVIVSQAVDPHVIEPFQPNENLRRPWLCNLPFAWLFHPRCWVLANRNPLFTIDEFNQMAWQ